MNVYIKKNSISVYQGGVAVVSSLQPDSITLILDDGTASIPIVTAMQYLEHLVNEKDALDILRRLREG